VRLNTLDIGGNMTGSQSTYSSYGRGGAGATMMAGFDTSHDGGLLSAFSLDYGVRGSAVKALGAGADVPNAGSTFQGIVKSGGNEFHGRYLVAGQDAAEHARRLYASRQRIHTRAAMIEDLGDLAIMLIERKEP
jgi:hypothetical protein